MKILLQCQSKPAVHFNGKWCSMLVLLLLTANFLLAQSPNEVITSVNNRFSKVNDYTANVNVSCNISFIKIEPINAKVFYKRPDKFRVKSTGILILPKQNANFYFTALADTNSFTAVKTGEEMIGGVQVQVINVIPSADTSDLILGKFWIDNVKGLVLKSQLTTKSQGTILVENVYGSMKEYALPDKMLFTVDVGKFKIPKALAADLNHTANNKTSQGDNKGRITLTFSGYAVNKGVSNDVFK
ncbi:MAG: hypothetical protein IPO83_07145 [Chitinophagaceae bacterium]|nr:hypothetical protein [Chitinophagaceae bacterium]